MGFSFQHVGGGGLTIVDAGLLTELVPELVVSYVVKKTSRREGSKRAGLPESVSNSDIGRSGVGYPGELTTLFHRADFDAIVHFTQLRPAFQPLL
jgi:hypothetical protein